MTHDYQAAYTNLQDAATELNQALATRRRGIMSWYEFMGPVGQKFQNAAKGVTGNIAEPVEAGDVRLDVLADAVEDLRNVLKKNKPYLFQWVVSVSVRAANVSRLLATAGIGSG